MFSKAFPVRNGPRFSKLAFHLDWERREMRCPNDVVLPFTPGGKVQFPAEVCAGCPLRERCTTDERLLAELRARQQTPSHCPAHQPHCPRGGGMSGGQAAAEPGVVAVDESCGLVPSIGPSLFSGRTRIQA